jgi:hypothetical protein
MLPIDLEHHWEHMVSIMCFVTSWYHFSYVPQLFLCPRHYVARDLGDQKVNPKKEKPLPNMANRMIAFLT